MFIILKHPRKKSTILLKMQQKKATNSIGVSCNHQTINFYFAHKLHWTLGIKLDEFSFYSISNFTKKMQNIILFHIIIDKLLLIPNTFLGITVI